MKHRLIAGTINHWPDTEEWQNWSLDVSPRPVWSSDLSIAVLPNFVADIAGGLPEFRSGMFDEIRCHHVLEHLTYRGAADAVLTFFRILRPDGVLDVEVPDFERISAAFAAGDLDWDGLQQWLHGEQLPQHQAGDSHRTSWTEPELRTVITRAGFDLGHREESGLALRIRAWKAPE